MSQAVQPRIGLIAGWGRFPIVTARALSEQGYGVICVGVREHVDPAIAEFCEAFTQAGVARLGSHIRFLRRYGVKEAVMAGKIHKASVLYRRGGWLGLIPDLTTLRAFFPHFISRTRDRKDDSLLLAVVDAFARRGIRFVPAVDFAPELLVKHGSLGKRRPTAAEMQDIAFGWKLAKELGRLDVGQSVVVKGQAAIALEAVEGTDACIRRAGELCPQGGFTVVKTAKPNQDMRFDVPTIGLGTIETIANAGGTVLAVEAGRTILIDQADVIALADRLGISLVALDERELEV